MKEVKVYSKFKCDFCNKITVKFRMECHEVICYLNPNRLCRLNTRIGHVLVDPKHEKHDKDCSDCIKSKKAIKRKEDGQINY